MRILIAPPKRSARHSEPGRPSAQRLIRSHTRTPASRRRTAPRAPFTPPTKPATRRLYQCSTPE